MAGVVLLPRMTRSLRAFTQLEPPRDLTPGPDDFEWQAQWNKEQLKKGFSWSDVVAIIENDTSSNSEVLKCVQKLRSLCGKLMDDQSKSVIDDTCYFVMLLFLTDNRVVSQKQLHSLRGMFGSISNNAADSLRKNIREILDELSYGAIEKLHDVLSAQESPQSDTFPATISCAFSSHIKYIPQKPWEPDTSALADLTDDIATGGESVAAKEFTMRYDGSTVASTAGSSSHNRGTKKCLYGMSWMESEVKKYYADSNPCGLSGKEFCDSVITLLRSERGDDALQNELFDLMGFDRFELIQTFLEHRKDIVQGVSLEIEKKNFSTKAGNISAAIENARAPSFGCQVVVQSQMEKQLQKLARKEEKRIHKVLGKLDLDEEEEAEFNPIELRAKRQAALKAAATVPILNKEPMRQALQPRPNYPNVYDAQSHAKQASGFISGTSIMLPEGVIRNDKKSYEEVIIPVAETAPVNVGNERVAISSLDDIGQLAFQGIKTLNRIQSVVFQAAYHSNDNLLICAPTGAGKTNVAMLTVVHQIRQHIEKGVIMNDQFKIVYVAPMKALAAEMTASFGKRLNPLGVSVRELTGDMQLTKSEIMKTQMLVTTPEKWDVVTRKGTGDVALTNLVKLLIIDEVHLLHGDRGPVVEALVARTLRQVESSQKMIRIVGLSATLPNYIDVARFLRVNPYAGLFFFDSRFRPVPLSQTFIGVKAVKPLVQMQEMDNVCYEKVVDLVQKGHQVMVFVHARNATVRTANVLKEMALQKGQLKLFQVEESSALGQARNALSRSRNKHLGELFQCGFSVHHAGMLRSDRSIVEKYFGDGLIKVLCCTSTLAWGVNLPAHGVVIRGTEIYDAKHGSFVDLGILDVLQIFGRAGRPQFDTSGTGIIITSHDKLSHYLSLLTNQFPIESNFIKFLADNLNAEVTLGTISNLDEAVEWLSYTYLFVRMRINPQVYGLNYQDVINDPSLEEKRRDLIKIAAKALDKARMLSYNERTGDLRVTDMGRTASHFYVKYDTVEVFNEMMKPIMNEAEILAMISHSQEFEQLKVRDDELDELDTLTADCCFVPVAGGSENLHGKVNILLQTYLSRGRINSFSLMSDQAYVSQNAVRIARALFDVVIKKNNPIMAGRFLMISKMFELQLWDFQSPMRQFHIITPDLQEKLEDRKLTVEKLRDMDVKEIGSFLRHPKMGVVVKRCAEEFPLVEMSASLHPITRTVLRIRLKIKANFRWNDKFHGKTSEAFWVWVEDPDNNHMYHYEYFLLTKKQVHFREEQELVMTIPLMDPLPPQYYVRATSDRWLGSQSYLELSFRHLIRPESHPPHTDLLELQPLPVTALNETQFEMLYKFSHFNPIQTQIFHCLYHTDNNVLLGAPTGSGKTIAAEIAMFRVFKQYPGRKVVYIAPLKALVRERISDWKIRLEKKLNKKVVELTGDVSPDVRAIIAADVIVTTPEKWDGISRSWQTRNYVRDVALIVIDEIHLLGEDRGPVLEVIVSRTNFIASHTTKTLRIIGLSTALANARDLANWLGIGEMGLYNFRPSVRPVPLEVHIAGFPGKHYCPRMATMNRPTFQAIRQHSPCQPVLVFVSSRRQTRLTALDLIAFLAGEDDQKQWMHTDEAEMEQIIAGIKDSSLKLTLAFGIGIHHAGLQERDRMTVEELFVNRKIQVLIATATLAWGVNFPAHMVVVKGTEYYDGKTRRYVDMPITDVLQMMGRAGRPQHDDQGVAVVLVHDVKKNFYKKFLYEPFPVESSLLAVLPDHLNAEIVAGTIRSRQDALDYLTWTYFFRRLLQNPSYYNLESLEPQDVNHYLSTLIEKAFRDLGIAGCIKMDYEDERSVLTTSFGRIASFYYLSHKTMMHFSSALRSDLSDEEVLKALCDVHEYYELPVRHNEDLMNAELAKDCPISVDAMNMDSPHVKANLLLQAHFSRVPLPCADYLTDLKSVLDQAIRILQAMIDVCAESAWLATTLRAQQLLQQVVQGAWANKSPLLTLPFFEPQHMYLFAKVDDSLATLPGLKEACFNNYEKLASILRGDFDDGEIEQVYKVLNEMPTVNVQLSIRGWWDGSSQEEEAERKIKIPADRENWVEVHAEQEYTLVVNLHRLNHSRDLKAHAPRFSRAKDEGWFLTLGSVDDNELLALKRVSGVRGRSTQQLSFYTPSKPGRIILTIYLMSDSYLGLDQQYDIYLEVIPANFKCQMNTDLAGLSIESLDSLEPHEEAGNEDVSEQW